MSRTRYHGPLLVLTVVLIAQCGFAEEVAFKEAYPATSVYLEEAEKELDAPGDLRALERVRTALIETDNRKGIHDEPLRDALLRAVDLVGLELIAAVIVDTRVEDATVRWTAFDAMFRYSNGYRTYTISHLPALSRAYVHTYTDPTRSLQFGPFAMRSRIALAIADITGRKPVARQDRLNILRIQLTHPRTWLITHLETALDTGEFDKKQREAIEESLTIARKAFSRTLAETEALCRGEDVLKYAIDELREHDLSIEQLPVVLRLARHWANESAKHPEGSVRSARGIIASRRLHEIMAETLEFDPLPEKSPYAPGIRIALEWEAEQLELAKENFADDPDAVTEIDKLLDEANRLLAGLNTE